MVLYVHIYCLWVICGYFIMMDDHIRDPRPPSFLIGERPSGSGAYQKIAPVRHFSAGYCTSSALRSLGAYLGLIWGCWVELGVWGTPGVVGGGGGGFCAMDSLLSLIYYDR